MRCVVQRVASARVVAAGETVGEIGRGLLVLAAVERGDTEDEFAWTARKIAELRIFPDKEDRMNLSVKEVGGAILAVSQFTLAARLKKGRRPSWSRAEKPELAELGFARFVQLLQEQDLPTETGSFGAMMRVELVNDGPVTLILERARAEGSASS